MILDIKWNIANTEVELCSGWCQWGKCSQPKRICLNCGHVECLSCINVHSDLVLDDFSTKESICRKCGSFDSWDEFAEEWRYKSSLVIEFVGVGEKKIAKSEWEALAEMSAHLNLNLTGSGLKLPVFNPNYNQIRACQEWRRVNIIGSEY